VEKRSSLSSSLLSFKFKAHARWFPAERFGLWISSYGEFAANQALLQIGQFLLEFAAQNRQRNN
jgi:hypothetical protein